MKYPIAIRTRSEGDWFGTEHFQNMEIRNDGTSGAITSVQKCHMMLEIYEI